MKRKNEPPGSFPGWLGVQDAPDWRVARPLGPAIAVLLGLLFLAALGAAVSLLVRAIGGGERSLGTGALIVAILSAPFLFWNTYTRHRALGFQKEGHLTDRLAQAVEQLGAEKTVKQVVTDADGQPVTQETTEPNLEVRIGGLLSLERIAQDSTAYDRGRDHVRVMEIICAYIRNNAPASMAQDFPGGDLGDWPEDADVEKRAVHLDRIKDRYDRDGKFQAWIKSLPPAREDVMLALTILERRSDRQRRIEAAHGQEGVIEADWVFDTPCPRLPYRGEEPLTANESGAFKVTLAAGKTRWPVIPATVWICAGPVCKGLHSLAFDWVGCVSIPRALRGRPFRGRILKERTFLRRVSINLRYFRKPCSRVHVFGG